MSNILVNDDTQPVASAFASLPSADELANASQLEKDALANPQPVVDNASQDDGIPDKFKGKSAAEIAQSYAELESELGRRSSEVGTLRSLTDQLLDVKRTEDLQNNGGQPQPTEVTADDLLADPRTAITTVANDANAAQTQRIDSLEATLALQAFEGRHPTFKADQDDPDFKKFVTGSVYRTNLAARAAQGDLNAAEELWSGYGDVRGSAADTTQQADTVAAQEQKQLDDATAIASSGGQGGESQPKAVSRADIIQKRIDDPDGYYDPTFQTWLNGMYQKGLVK